MISMFCTHANFNKIIIIFNVELWMANYGRQCSDAGYARNNDLFSRTSSSLLLRLPFLVSVLIQIRVVAAFAATNSIIIARAECA